MKVIPFKSAALELDRLKYEAIRLVRICKHPKTMKALLHLYDIFETTQQINEPWESHPGVFYGDMSAFIEIESVSASLVVYQDPDLDSITAFQAKCRNIVAMWKRHSENRMTLRLIKN